MKYRLQHAEMIILQTSDTEIDFQSGTDTPHTESNRDTFEGTSTSQAQSDSSSGFGSEVCDGTQTSRTNGIGSESNEFLLTADDNSVPTNGFASGSTEAALECLLFVSGEPIAIVDLARALGMDEISVESALRSLQVTLKERGSGLQALRIAGGWQLATRHEHAGAIGRMLTRGSSKLSRAAMETLAIVAYRQPITAPEIEAVRGVNVSGVLKTLLERRLVMEAGRKPTLGRPMQYTTTNDFLHYFALADLTQLPPLESDLTPPAAVTAAEVADGIVSDDLPSEVPEASE